MPGGDHDEAEVILRQLERQLARIRATQQPGQQTTREAPAPPPGPKPLVPHKADKDEFLPGGAVARSTTPVHPATLPSERAVPPVFLCASVVALGIAAAVTAFLVLETAGALSACGVAVTAGVVALRAPRLRTLATCWIAGLAVGVLVALVS
jgi:hypothetical protein